MCTILSLLAKAFERLSASPFAPVKALPRFCTLTSASLIPSLPVIFILKLTVLSDIFYYICRVNL